MPFCFWRRLAYSTRICLIVPAVFFVLAVKDAVLYDWFSERGPVDSDSILFWEGEPIAKGNPQWQKVDNLSQVFVYSAHYDDMESPPLIRIIGVALDPLPYFYVTCRYFQNPAGPIINNVSGTLVHMRDRNGRRYLGAYLECPLGKLQDNALPYALSVDKGNTFQRFNYLVINYGSDNDWGNYEHNQLEEYESDSSEQYSGTPWPTPSAWRWNVTRCFPVFQMDYNDYVMLAEMVAASRLLGVQHFVFYVQSAGPRILAMLEVLQQQGDAEVLPWNIYLEDEDLYYAGQVSSINDCLYRHLWTSRFLLFGDVDELFVPRDQLSLPHLLDEQFTLNPECGAFLFLNVFFNLNFPAANLSPNARETTLWPLLQILPHTRRHVEILGPAERSKPAVDPRKVKTSSVHVIQTFRDGYESCVMESGKGLLHHYRKFSLPPADQQIEDPYLWEFYDELVAEIEFIMGEHNEIII